MKKIIFFFGIMFYQISSSFCNDIQIKTQIDKKEAFIGDIIHLNLTITRPNDSQLKPPETEKIQPFEVKDFKILEKKLKDQKTQTTLSYALTIFETGEHVLGPWHLIYQSALGQPQDVSTEAITIHVKSLLPTDAKEIDIRGPKPPLFLKRDWTWLYILFAILIVLAIVTFILIKKFKLSASVPLSTPVLILSPKEEALKKLEALSASDALKEGRWKEVFSALSEILKHYLERQFHFNALEMTTFECIRELKKRKTHIEIVEKLRSVLNEADLIKFAKYFPSTADIEHDFKLAKEVVEQSEEEIRHAI